MTILLLLLACGPKAASPDAPAPAAAEAAPVKDSKSKAGYAPVESEAPAVSIPIVPLETPNFESPAATLGTLIHAVQARDLEAYARCFTAAAIEGREAGVERLQGDAAERSWAELEGIFTGPLNFDAMDVSGDGLRARAHVYAPEARGGGIGSVSFAKDEEGWKVDRW